jgi:hypothetical protein
MESSLSYINKMWIASNILQKGEICHSFIIVRTNERKTHQQLITNRAYLKKLLKHIFMATEDNKKRAKPT